MTRQGRPKTLCTNRPWQELAWIDCQKEFFVVNTTVLSNKMYRDNPLAFWSETADNSLNWKLQPELNYPELPWKLQTTKLNYNYLEYRSKTAGNSLFFNKLDTLLKPCSWGKIAVFIVNIFKILEILGNNEYFLDFARLVVVKRGFTCFKKLCILH